MFQYPHPCLGSLTAVKPAPFWCHIWPNSWVAKKMDELGGLIECGVQSSAASFACLPASETSGFAWHKEALGSIFKCCHLPALQLASWGEGMDQAGSLAGPWSRGGGGGIVWEIAELVSANRAHPAVIFNWEAWRVGRWVFRATPATAPGY